ncbi:MAG: hypothetical protein NZL83_04930, partial [Candidatus Absconditabacterales bacterium]|nr:hypothetical protein [Candidatus Absconditabacterales bacterium]
QIPVKNPLYSDLCPNNQSDNAIFDRNNGLLYFRSSSATSMNVSGVVYQLRHCASPFFLDDAKITYLDRPLDNYQQIDRESFFLLGDQYVSDKNTIRYQHHALGPRHSGIQFINQGGKSFLFDTETIYFHNMKLDRIGRDDSMMLQVIADYEKTISDR